MEIVVVSKMEIPTFNCGEYAIIRFGKSNHFTDLCIAWNGQHASANKGDDRDAHLPFLFQTLYPLLLGQKFFINHGLSLGVYARCRKSLVFRIVYSRGRQSGDSRFFV